MDDGKPASSGDAMLTVFEWCLARVCSGDASDEDCRRWAECWGLEVRSLRAGARITAQGWKACESENAALRAELAALRAPVVSKTETAPAVAEQVAAIGKGIYGGNSDPNRCVCAEQETGKYADTPHVHYDKPPYACARCKCAAYHPAVIPEDTRTPAPPTGTSPAETIDALRAEVARLRELAEDAQAEATTLRDLFVIAGRK